MNFSKKSPLSESFWVKSLLIAIALIFLGIILVFPAVIIFIEALSKGLKMYFESFNDQNARAAIFLTLLVSLFVVPLNTIFGICASWVVTKFDFKGKHLLITFIDLPFSVSPVIAGLIFALLYGSQLAFGNWLIEHNIRILFSMAALVMVTIFVTFPFVARELIPIMNEQGAVDEEVAVSLGASGLKTFFRVTLPNIKWGLLYGVLLCNARAMGEFGAVSVVSGHIAGKTTTIPLYVQILYDDYNTVAAFAVASILTILALITLILKSVLEYRQAKVGHGG
jgi:sulfate transport system permease protein